MATIRKRGKAWQVQVRQANKPAMTKSFSRKIDAIHWAQTIEGLLRDESPVNMRRDRQITLKDAIHKYLDTVSNNKRGRKEECSRLKRIAKEQFSEKQLYKITSADIAQYRDERLRVVRPATVRRELTVLRHLFSIAKKEWGIWIAENPVANVTIPSCSIAREIRISDDELLRLIQAVGNKTTIPLAKIIRFAVLTAMRKSEIVAISPEHLNQDSTLLIPMTKNGHPRSIPLHPDAIKILQDVGGTFDVTSSGLRMAFDRARRRAGLSDIRFHDLRHEAISRFFEMGLSIPEVMKISGHTDVRMLMRYTHPKAHDIAKKLVQIPSHLAVASVLLSQEVDLCTGKSVAGEYFDRSDSLSKFSQQMEQHFGFPPSPSIVRSAIKAFESGLSINEYLCRFEHVSGMTRLE